MLPKGRRDRDDGHVCRLRPGDQPLLEGTVDAQEAAITDMVGSNIIYAGFRRDSCCRRNLGLDVFYGDCLFTTEDEVAQHQARVARFAGRS